MRPMRAWDVFLATLLWVFLILLATMAVAGLLALQEPLNGPQTRALLGLLYWGTYPAAFVAFGALVWHFVGFYRGRGAGGHP